MAVGHLLLAKTLSCPAPLVVLINAIPGAAPAEPIPRRSLDTLNRLLRESICATPKVSLFSAWTDLLFFE